MKHQVTTNTNYLIQVIRGKTIFVIHEYVFGVRSENSRYDTLDNLSQAFRCLPNGYMELATIRGTDRLVKTMADT